MRVLIVEDNKRLAGYIQKALQQEGYAADTVFDGELGEKRARFGHYDILLLDSMLPKKSGVMVCRTLRDEHLALPILMLTARGEVEDKIEGLDSGADDYLTKPFELKELLARIRALLRRPAETVGGVLSGQDIRLESAEHRVKKGKDEIRLTLKEYMVLEYLLRNKGRVVNREQILDHCWEFAFDSFSNIVDVYIKQLRKKLGDTDERYIQTIRGVGYKFQE